ncbi:MAG: lysophospholipid acyltransferase family protein [Candidatus Omnitrophota bacterium]
MAKKKFYRYPIYLGARLLAAVLSVLPRAALLGLARFGGRLAFGLVKRHRDRTLSNLTRVYGRKKSEAEIRAIAVKVFENLAETLAEFLKYRGLTFEKMASFVDFGEVFRVCDGLLAEGKGVICMTAHLGNWELLAGAFTLKGYPGAVIGRKIYYEPYNRWILSLREAIKVRTIYRDEAVREIYEVLQKNQIIGILPDQDIDSLKGIHVDYFGLPAYTPVAPARIALATGAPMVTSFLVRTGGGHYRFVVGDVIRARVKTTREAAVREATEAWMKSFEKVIREYPEQWVWMHDRWKTQPAVSPLKSAAAPASSYRMAGIAL